jgi:hypothetical protein
LEFSASSAGEIKRIKRQNDDFAAQVKQMEWAVSYMSGQVKIWPGLPNGD